MTCLSTGKIIGAKQHWPKLSASDRKMLLPCFWDVLIRTLRTAMAIPLYQAPLFMGMRRWYDCFSVQTAFQSTQGISVGQTPLLQAAQVANVEIVKLLMAHGARINDRDKERRTPLSYAAEWGNASTVKGRCYSLPPSQITPPTRISDIQAFHSEYPTHHTQTSHTYRS
jgi:hypothetical protein